jgi:predicted nucleic acid-binding protein
VWVEAARGTLDAWRYLQNAKAEGLVAYSIVNRIETLRGARDKREQRSLERLFEPYEVVSLIEEDGWQAERIVKSYSRMNGIIAIDALVAATALRKGMILTTLNDRHFRGIHNLQIERPY